MHGYNRSRILSGVFFHLLLSLFVNKQYDRLIPKYCLGNHTYRCQQPDRFYDRPPLLPLLAVLYRRGTRGQRPHLPRERRRPGGGDAGGQYCRGMAGNLAQGRRY